MVGQKKKPVALDFSANDEAAKDNKMKKFEEFKARQKLREDMRKAENEQRRRDGSKSPTPQTQMPKYGLKKPQDEKKQNAVIKRPVRNKNNFTPEAEIFAPKGMPHENQEDEIQDFSPDRGMVNNCDFNISPSKVPRAQKLSDDEKEFVSFEQLDDDVPLNESLSKLPRMISNRAEQESSHRPVSARLPSGANNQFA